MQVEKLPSRKAKKSSVSFKLFLALLIALFLTASILILYIVIQQVKVNDERVLPYPEPELHDELGTFYPVIYQGVLEEDKVLHQGEEFYIPLDMLVTYIDPTLHYDAGEQVLILTTEHNVITLKSNALTNEIKGETTELQFPILEADGEVYVPYSPFTDVYPFSFTLHEQTNVLELRSNLHVPVQGRAYAPVAEGKEPEYVYVRTEPTVEAPYVEALAHDTEIEMITEQSGWYYVQTEAGALGFVPKEDAVFTGIMKLPIADLSGSGFDGDKESFQAWNPIGSKINMTWEHVVSRTPNPDNIDPMPGVNVVSPTWFHFQDEDGSLSNFADKSYVDWAHQQGYQVWALVTNEFDPDLTTTILSSYEKRRNVIRQLVYFSELYDLDGINIDFENVYLADKENVVQFMRELTPYMHDLGLVVSIDVTIKSTSEMWSMFLDRPALGEIVDYMMIMTYDEHWGSSPVAGSVASLPWVENGLRGVLEEVPNEKVLLGIPFYTRLWKEEQGEDGQTKVSSRAFSMSGIENWMAERDVDFTFDEATGQHYAEYEDTEEKAVYKIWLEDERSVAQRIELVHKYDLAGVASWRRGFEKPVIWEVIEEGLHSVQ
ncbi:glycosyl hydrolase family 18 protein [Bacillus horti]|uniref:Spore germination protein YaaH n=1 Tax=Caldalkalibacillus horti TaxID=77523 RepID=A0ABT9W1E6_9BACI|nr:glycosyl hydrolase family 18 protein [Bacillus horti]MDQ0167083.1 spore germination protein YaaH [Bacillus horti]